MTENFDNEHEQLIIEISDTDSDNSADSAPAESNRQASTGPTAHHKKLYCRNCGRQGHIAKFCYQKRQYQNDAAQSRNNHGSNNAINHERHEIARDRRGTSRRPLVDLSDNAGYQLWRDKRAHYSTLDFPPGFEVAADIFGERSRPVRIGYFTQTYIEMSRPVRNGKYRAAIWAAEPEHNDAARARLEEWRDEVVPLGSRRAKSNAAGAGRGGQPSDRDGGVSDALLARRKFTRDFAPDEMFAKFYRVDWALKYENLSPENVLGHRLEALDTIRMDHQVYIKLNGKSFGVFGANELEARKACIRLQNVQWNALAKDCPSYQFYLVKPVPHLEMRSSVVHADYVESQLLDQDRVSDETPDDHKFMLFGPQFMDAYAWSSWTQEHAESIERNELLPNGTSVTIANVSDKLNALYIELWFTKLMKHQPYYVGQLRLRASIGTCLMTRRIVGDEFDIDLFCQHFDSQNRDQNGIESEFTEELGDRDVELNLLQRFMDEKAPIDAQGMAIDRYDADGNLSFAPHSMSIQFNVVNGEDKYELHLTFDNFQSNVGIATWMKAGDDFPFLDINLLDLQASHLSYNLQATWIDVLGKDQLWKLPASWTKFADLVRIDADAIRDPRNYKQAFKFPGGSGGSLPITDFIQKQVWRFNMRESAYIVELHRLQKFDCAIDDFGIEHAAAYEPRWGIQIYHPIWDRHLAANAALKLGYRGSWSATEHEFFPLHSADEQGPSSSSIPPPAGSVWVRGSGIREWLRSMAIVEKIISGGYSDGSGDVKQSLPVRGRRQQTQEPVERLINV